MIRECFSLFSLILIFGCATMAQEQFETDTISTSEGDLKITFIGHGSLLFTFNSKNIYIDPYGKLADYSQMPKADIILIAHEHSDHLDMDAVRAIRTEKTALVITEKCQDQISDGIVMKNGSTQTIQDLKIEAVPAYNIVHKRDNDQPFHPKGVGNGYIITFADKQVYIAGDTENIPGMKELRDIDIAFLPMNLPYTMTPEMVVDAVKMFRPEILYPYHFGETDIGKLVELMKGHKDIEVRTRKMK